MVLLKIMNNSTSEAIRKISLLARHKNNLLWLKATIGLYVLTLVLGFLGNLIVLIVIARKKIRMWRPHETFILNLAISDLMLITIFLPFQIYIFLVEFHSSVFYCKFIACLITVALGASIFTLTVMAIHRCYVITNPFKHGTISQQSVIIWLVLVWILSIVLVVPRILVSTAYSNRCIQQWPNQSIKKLYTVSLFIARFVIPLFIISIAYFRIAKDLARSPAPRFDLDENGQIKTRTARRENVEVTKTLAVIVVLFVLCMLPFRLNMIVMLFGNEDQVLLARTMRRYTSILTVIHSCTNPIAYGTLTKTFRSWLARYARWLNSLIQCRHLQRENNQEETVRSLKRTRKSSEHLRKFKLIHLISGNTQGMNLPVETTDTRLLQVRSKMIYRNRERKETAV